MVWTLLKAWEFDGPAGPFASPDWSLTNDRNYESGTLNWYRPQNVALDGSGNVVLTAKPEAYNGYAYTSGQMSTQQDNPLQVLWATPADNWAVEASVQLPSGSGLWPCGPWFLGASFDWHTPPGTGLRNWPSCGEVDHNERYQIGRNQIRVNLIRGDGSWEAHIITLPFNVDDAQHRYRTECSGGEWRCLVDDVLYVTFKKATVSNWAGTYDRPFTLICQVEVGGAGGTPDATTSWPARLILGSIRAYQGTPDSAPPPLPTGGTTMLATEATNRSGGWNALGTTLYAYGTPNWLEFKLPFDGSPQTLTLTTDLNWRDAVPLDYRYHFEVTVDGVAAGSIDAAPVSTGHLSVTKPAGVHTVRLTWTNDFWQPPQYDANVQVKSVAIEAGSGTPAPVPPTDPKVTVAQKLKGLGLSDAEVAVLVNP